MSCAQKATQHLPDVLSPLLFIVQTFNTPELYITEPNLKVNVHRGFDSVKRHLSMLFICLKEALYK